jgi:indole-3-glycerol phosphate synthase/phosphoribosylanthranilate isomerase
VKSLLDNGIIHAVQFHGDEDPACCFNEAFPYFKALRLRTSEDAAKIERFHSPRVLVDAFVENLSGGTGQEIPGPLVEETRQKKPLWLAGGIGPDNVAEIITRFKPELIDASSKLESSPGKKDHTLVERFFKEIERAAAEL